MEDVTRKRILRQLESLPEAQLYQVLDYIEFISAKYAAAAARKPDAFQRFAERVEDQMRVRSLAPKAMKGTMKIMSTAGKMIDGVRDLGRDLVTPPPQKPGADRPGGVEHTPRPAPDAAAGSPRSPQAQAPADAPGENGGPAEAKEGV